MAIEMLKPITDDREYKLITLSNGLEALLVHDPTTEKAAAALDVHIGSYADPVELPGLAHFLEHLLFMGTEKYPDENEYSRFLADHAGISNAYTAPEETNFHFEVAADALDGALDRFSRFFIDPLFSPDAKDREIMAVNSENKKNLQSDMWRINQLERSLSNPAHPYVCFSTGNYQTLGAEPKKRGIDVRERLIAFYKQHYAAHLMKLVVAGTQSIAELEEMVVSKFSQIPDDPEKHALAYSEPPLTPRELGVVIKAEPIMDLRQIELAFPIPDQQPDIDVQPARYWSHLINHEAQGSLLHYLKEMQWASEVRAGISHISAGYDTFLIDVELTNAGYKKWESVVAAVFKYLDILREAGPREDIFEEVRIMSEASFRFRQKSKAFAFVRNTSSVMQRPIPRERILNLNVTKKFDSKAIAAFGTLLVPSNTRAMLTATCDGPADDVYDQQEYWYGTRYNVSSFDFASLRAPPETDQLLRMPAPNEYMPHSFDVIQSPQVGENPRLVLRDDEAMLKVWHKPDDTFGVPKATVYVKIVESSVADSAASFMTAELVVQLITDMLSEETYYALAAGIQFSMGLVQDGIELEVSGFSDQLLRLVERMISAILLIPATDVVRRFDVVKEKLERLMLNVRMMQPYAQIQSISNFLLAERVYSLDSKLEALRRITPEDLEKWLVTSRKTGLGIEMLVVGNIDSRASCEIALQLRELAVVPKRSPERAHSYLLPEGCTAYWKHALADPAQTNSAIDYCIQVGERRDLRRYAALLLLVQIMAEPTFHQLRTIEMLGYVVGAAKRILRGTLYLRIFVQSEEPTSHLEKRIHYLLAEVIYPLLKKMSDSDWSSAVQSVVHQQLEKPRNMNEEATRIWSAINAGTCDFGRRHELARLAQQITHGELLALYEELMLPSSSQHSVFVTHLQPQKPSSVDPETALARAVGKLVVERHISVSSSDITVFAQQCRGLSPAEAMQLLAKKLVEVGQTPEQARQFVADALEAVQVQAQPADIPLTGTPVVDADKWTSSLKLAPLPDVVDIAVYEAKL